MNRYPGMKCSTDQKQKIKDMLRDAICVLCQNTVAHSVQLSIDALIGITVDGEDVVLVNIQEFLNKQGSSNEEQVASAGEAFENDEGEWDADETAADEQYYYENEEGSEFPVANVLNEHYGNGMVVKQESTSISTYTVSRKSAHGQGGHSSVKNETYTNDPNNYFHGNSSFLDHPAVDSEMQYGMGDAPKVKTETPRRHSFPQRGRGGSAPRMPRKRPAAVAARSLATSGPQDMFKQEATEDGNWSQPSAKGSRKVIDEEVEHVTIYKCSQCGAQMKNRQSFVRHKRSHEGIVYRCEACGKILSRHDHLLAHRRRCPAALQQQPVADG